MCDICVHEEVHIVCEVWTCAHVYHISVRFLCMHVYCVRTCMSTCLCACGVYALWVCSCIAYVQTWSVGCGAPDRSDTRDRGKVGHDSVGVNVQIEGLQRGRLCP